MESVYLFHSLSLPLYLSIYSLSLYLWVYQGQPDVGCFESHGRQFKILHMFVLAKCVNRYRFIGSVEIYIATIFSMHAYALLHA